MPVLDKETALHRVGGDPELLAEIGHLFLSEYPSLVDRMAAAIPAHDAQSLERAAHSLKGSVANFGAQPAVDAAFALEQAGRSGDLSRAPQLLTTLLQHLRTLHSELAAL